MDLVTSTFGQKLADKAGGEGLPQDFGHGVYASGGGVGRQGGTGLEGGSAVKDGRFPFLANSRVKSNFDTEGQVKFLVRCQMSPSLALVCSYFILC